MNDLRAPTEDDIAAVVELRSRYAPEPFAADRVRWEWAEPGFDVERDARICAGGYAAVEALDESRTWIELHGERIEPALAWALERAPSNRAFSGSWEADEPVRRALEGAGFRQVRHSYRMAIDLGEGLPEPLWPDGIAPRSFSEDDATAAYETHMETFEDSWEHIRQPYDQWVHWSVGRPDFDPELFLLAAAGDDLAGISRCRVHETQREIGWVSVLGVRRPWRGQGVGRALLLESFRRLARNGCRQAVLGVDASSVTGATRLYEKAGMRIVSTFDIYELSA